MVNFDKQACINAIREYTGILVNEDQFDMLVASQDPTIPERIFDFGIDTIERENLMDAVARQLTGRNWPTYGEGDEVLVSFLETLKYNADEYGYGVE